MSFRLLTLAAATLFTVALTACTSGTHGVLPGGPGPAATARSGADRPPMPVGSPLPAEAMTSGAQDHRQQMTAQARAAMSERDGSSLSLTWSYTPASAVQVVVAPDGSLWALGTQPAGPDKSIWHYVASRWVNVPGAASRIAVAADGTVWAITSLGSLYHFDGARWSTIGGASQDVTVDPFGTVYVVAKGSLANEPIWQYTAMGGFGPATGAGARVFSQPDLTLFVITSAGSIYDRPAGSATYVQCPGAANELAPLLGSGFYALAYSSTPSSGSAVYAFSENAPGDCRTGTYQPTNGFGTSISANSGVLAVVGTDGAIYTTSTSTAP